MDFAAQFRALTDNEPFPWQRALYDRFVAGDFPRACDIPTGLGKTSVIAIWLLALIKNSNLPRRLVYVVNRRTVVDQATAEAERIRQRLLGAGMEELRKACTAMAVTPSEAPIAISTLRGEFADNGEWWQDPSRPSIIVGTVDMIGSRLLFSGYGLGFRRRPLHAGFLGQDALLVHDEAHLEPAFQHLLTEVEAEQQRCQEPRPLKVLALTATGRSPADFSLGPEDLEHPVVIRRVQARKGLHIHRVDAKAKLVDSVVELAQRLEGRIVVFLSSLDDTAKCADRLRKLSKDRVATLTGTMRGRERDELIRHPVFARFLPKPPQDVRLVEGTVFLVSTSAGEVGIDISADHLVSDLVPFDAFVQRLGRVNRYGSGDAEVHLCHEPLKGAVACESGGESDDDDANPPASTKEEYERSRAQTLQLLKSLPVRNDGAWDVSPAAVRGLSLNARIEASTPVPVIPRVDGMLFDRWSYTSFRSKDNLPGRPAVAEWLHGRAEWELPRTVVAWRDEVNWLDPEDLGSEELDDFLADYPLRARETLSDVTYRVVKHLKQIEARAAKNNGTGLRVWLLRPDEPAEFIRLDELLNKYDSKRNPILEDATLILPPIAGGLLSTGMLDGSAAYSDEIAYDIGSQAGDREVRPMAESADPPAGMRLIRAMRRLLDSEEERWWCLFAVPGRAENDGSRTSVTDALTLDRHTELVESFTTRLVDRLALPAEECAALVAAARAHDLGKRRRVWQRSIRRYQDPPLAKGKVRPADLGGYRHEVGSLHDASFPDLSESARDLALHLIAAHHGRARPHFPVNEAFDPELREEVISAVLFEVPLRFDRLQQRYGRWGLAWLESLLRAADVWGSEERGIADD